MIGRNWLPEWIELKLPQKGGAEAMVGQDDVLITNLRLQGNYSLLQIESK